MPQKTGALRKTVFIFGFGLLLAIILLPFATNGFWTDDALNSQTWGMINRFHTSIWDFSYRVSRVWLVNHGRILFPWPAIYAFFYVFKSELAARLADIALFIGHIAVTVVLLRRLEISWRIIALFGLTLTALLQIRDANDPLAAYAVLSQGVGILLMISLLLLHKWHETKSAAWLIASSLLASLSMTCYEINAVYIPIALTIVAMSVERKLLRNIAIISLPFMCYVAVNIYLKKIATTPYNGSALGELNAIPVTFIKQLIATFPGSFYIFQGQYQFPISGLIVAAVTSVLAWCVLILWSTLTIRVLGIGSATQKHLKVAVFGAFLLLVVPPTLISISLKYQSLLIWGTGHVPIYYQSLGLAFLIAATVDRLLTDEKMRYAAFFVPIFGMWTALNWMINMQQSNLLDATYREPRDSLVAALHQGLFNGVREGDVMLIDSQPIYINGNLIYQETEINVSIPHETAIAGWFSSPPREDAKTYRLIREESPSRTWKLVRP